jgi:aminopeptidase N
MWGGMENTTLTTMNERILVTEKELPVRDADSIVAHELVHQWFGDLITTREWGQLYLNEGFATYLDPMCQEASKGGDEFRHIMQGEADGYFANDGDYRRPIVERRYLDPEDMFDAFSYNKASLVLHMMRRELGDDLFFEGVRRYLEKNAHGIVETTDLVRAFEEVSGRSLERFFDDWVYRPGHPDIKVKVSWDEELLTVSLKQKQRGDNVPHAFSLPLEIEVVDRQGKRTRHRTLVETDQGALSLSLPKRPAFVTFDPDFRVIGSVSLDVPSEDQDRRAL